MVGCITSTRGHWEEFLSLIQNNSCNVSNILLLSQLFIVWKSLTQPSTSDFMWEIEENHGLYSTSIFLPILKRHKFRLKNKIGKDVTFQGRKLSPAMWFSNVSAHNNPWWGCWMCLCLGPIPRGFWVRVFPTNSGWFWYRFYHAVFSKCLQRQWLPNALDWSVPSGPSPPISLIPCHPLSTSMLCSSAIWTSSCFFNMQSLVLPQGLCTSCLLLLECSFLCLTYLCPQMSSL